MCKCCTHRCVGSDVTMPGPDGLKLTAAMVRGRGGGRAALLLLATRGAGAAAVLAGTQATLGPASRILEASGARRVRPGPGPGVRTTPAGWARIGRGPAGTTVTYATK